MSIVSFQELTEATVDRAIVASDLSGSIGGGARRGRGDTIFLTARLAGTVRGDYDLMSGSYRDEGITSPQRLSVTRPIAFDAQPALSPDGSRLYFVSDRAGGLGGTDIYMSRSDGRGGWLPPENLGAGVNTPCDELSPFVTGNGRWLYFSSSGHATVGGYDLFRSPIVAGQVGGSSNLGRPINTSADEIFPSTPGTADPDTLLYYSSNQPGASGFDIHVLHRVRRRGVGLATTRTTRSTIKLTGTVRNRLGELVDSAMVRLEERDPPGRRDSMQTDRSGRYQFEIEKGKEYEITAGSAGTLYSRDSIFVSKTSRETSVRRDIGIPDTVTLRLNFPFNNATDPYEFVLDDRGLPTADRWTDLIDRAAGFLKQSRVGEGKPVEIVGHTDPLGTDAFNLDLGRRRAEFVRRALVARGVPPALLFVRSEGESQPLSTLEGESDELYRSRLRRVELVRR